MTADVPKRLFTIDEAAMYLGCSPVHVRRMIKAGKLEAVSGIKTIKIAFETLAEWVEAHKIIMSACRIIAIGNQKGGVGKTTTTHNLGYELAKQGYKTLMIDLDPQASLSTLCGKANLIEPTIATLYASLLNKNNIQTKEAIVSTMSDDGTYEGGHPNLDVIPGDQRFADTITQLKDDVRGPKSLKKILEPILGDYDFILLDTPPFLMNVVTPMSLIAAHFVIIPQTPDKLTLDSMERFVRIVQQIQMYENPDLKILGTLFTRCKMNTEAHNYVINEARIDIEKSSYIFDTMVKDSIVVTESQLIPLPLARYDKAKDIADQYHQFAMEVVKRSAILDNRVGARIIGAPDEFQRNTQQ